jgi:hypothetical protein
MKRGGWTRKPGKTIPRSGLKRSQKPMCQVSQKQGKRLREYGPISKKFLAENPICAICVARKKKPPNPSTEVHHLRGRVGRLLCDVRGFVASCFPCRDFPHTKVIKARELGVLAPANLWNVPFDPK